jgi:hypothetical protein
MRYRVFYWEDESRIKESREGVDPEGGFEVMVTTLLGNCSRNTHMTEITIPCPWDGSLDRAYMKKAQKYESLKAEIYLS